VVFSGLLNKGNNVLDIWRTDMSGGTLKQLSNGKVDESPVCSPDGRWVFYQDEVNGARIMKVSIDGEHRNKSRMSSRRVLTFLPIRRPWLSQRSDIWANISKPSEYSRWIPIKL